MDEESIVEITSEDNVAVVAFVAASISGVEAISAASEKTRGFIAQNNPKRVIFDFEQVKFFSSQILGLILDIRARIEPYDGEVVISGINPQLHRVFRITNLDRIFRFFPDRQTALEAADPE